MPLNQVDISMMQDIPAPGVSGKIIISDGTDWTSGENTPIVDLSQLSASNLTTGTVATARLGTGTADSTKFLRGDNTWQVVETGATQLNSPVITGTLSVLSGGSVSHTVANWSDDVSYTIVPTNCTVGAVNSSGVFVVTHTSGVPSYTIKATTDSLGLADSAVVTKNIVMTLTAPTLSSPADVGTAIDVVYTITSTDSNDDKLILNMGSSNFTYQSVSVGTASKVGNTVECIGFTTNNPAVTIQFTAEATYSVTATAVNTTGYYGTSASSNADSITIVNTTWTTATGGTVTTAGDYKMHQFDASGSFVVTAVGTDANFALLVIGGGGGGGGGIATEGGGGGAGGLKYYTGKTIAVGTHAIVIGGPGSGGASASRGSNGTATTFTAAGLSAISATGGGGGGSRNTGAQLGGTGGSGGGGGQRDDAVANYGAGTTNEGNRGGSGYEGSYWQGGGGGSAVAAGGHAGNNVAGNGGASVVDGTTSVYNWQTGSSTTLLMLVNNNWAGGGGGSDTGSGGTGGTGSGGAKGYNGSSGTGGGAGGNIGTNSYTGGGGGVIFRYKYQN